MGDRNNPIKFGPEWLRNLSRESNAGGSANNQNPTNSGTSNSASGSGQGTVSTGATSPPGPPGGTGAAVNPGGTAQAAGGSVPNSSSSGPNSRNSANNVAPKILLAKLRYGREEMLALYDRSSEAPEELKYFDLLYQPRGKPPVALNNTFEEEMRENIRGGPSTGGISQGERFGIGRGTGRGSSNENRGRSRMPFVRQASTGRGNSWHTGNTRLPGYTPAADEEPSPLWAWGGNNPNNPTPRVNNEQQEWAPNKVFRRRQTNNTNWRSSQTRDEGDEWRSQEGARNRPNVDKWDRDWGERPTQDRPQSWNSNRRTWVGGEGHNDDNLPEWAIDNAEAVAGTFDSSGAFHGYSNDDTNIPKTQDTSFPLVRSHTHGSFVRSKTIEEGSEEWWASEKAKKLSPKRFDASEIKFKKSSNTPVNDEGANVTNTDENETEVDKKPNEGEEKTATEKPEDFTPAEAETPEETNTSDNPKNSFKSKFTESKTFDALMRSDIDMEEVSDDRGNFQSVMITPTNSLRQKHQNIVTTANENTTRHGRIPVLQMLHTMPPNENDSCQTPEDKIVEDIFDLTLEDAKITTSSVTSSSSVPSSNSSEHRLSTQLSSGGMPMSIASPGMPSHVLAMTSTISTSVLQGNSLPTSGMQPGLLQSGALQARDIQTSVMQSPNAINMQQGGMQSGGMQPGGMQPGGMQPGGMQPGGMQPGGMQPGGIQSAGGIQHGVMQSVGGLQHGGMQVLQQGLMQQGNMSQGGMQQSGLHQVGMQQGGIQQGGMQSAGLQAGILQSGVLQSGGMQVGGLQGSSLQALQAAGLQTSGMATQGIQNVGIPNSALNSSLGLSLGSGNNGMGLPIQGVQPSILPNSQLSNPGLGAAGLQGRGNVLPGYQPTGGLNVLPGANVANSSLFLGQSNNLNNPMQSSNDLQMPNHAAQSNMFPMHGLQHSGSQASFGSIYSNLMPPPPNQNAQATQNLAEQWYYEDPKKIIQGPFSSKEMYNWYRAGFFSASLMVRRACDAHMRPLGSYGPMVPFAQLDVLSPFPMSGGFETRSQGPHDLLNQQQGLGLDDSLWSQPTPTPDLVWMQQAMNARNESRVNNLPLFFWDQQPSAISSNSLLPEEIAKEMKTEDQILAQLRASQNISTSQSMPFIGDQPPVSTSISNKPDEAFSPNTSATPNLEELQKLIKTEALASPPQSPPPSPSAAAVSEPEAENDETEVKPAKPQKDEQAPPVVETNNPKSQQIQSKVTTESKQIKTVKPENEKTVKTKDTNNPKNKNKKSKEEKKEEVVEQKTKEDTVATEQKRSVESSPSKSKKEDKQNRKELEKERKEWVKEGFTIVKGSEKNTAKETKKKVEEVKASDDTDRKRKEEDENACDEKKEKKVTENQKKQQQEQFQRQLENMAKRAPWSTASGLQAQAASKDVTLAEIQRLEREKKMEQIKVQQQMMQIIAQQQAAVVAREQEMQAGLGWAKKKASIQLGGQSLAEIQAEARRQAAVAAAYEEAQALLQPNVSIPWVTASNACGFWDPQPNKTSEKSQEKTGENKNNKKKTAPVFTPKKEATPTPEIEFESWCTSVLNLWNNKIDVPTFIGFLKDIESPYEVKDYVKFYLGESKDAYDFARQFLERRSKLLRVGMVTPSDDLCSPAMAINPRNPSSSDYQEVKGKGKKSKKNKMLKVDSRILGFSVTAAEDRINVGDIDTA